MWVIIAFYGFGDSIKEESFHDTQRLASFLTPGWQDGINVKLYFFHPIINLWGTVPQTSRCG
jgi:hypothetical protein